MNDGAGSVSGGSNASTSSNTSTGSNAASRFGTEAEAPEKASSSPSSPMSPLARKLYRVSSARRQGLISSKQKSIVKERILATERDRWNASPLPSADHDQGNDEADERDHAAGAAEPTPATAAPPADATSQA